ncbi:MAG: ERF family protein [Thermacetogeniaceae bacterium]
MAECKSLACKLAQVMSEVQSVPKKGYNDFHKYNYVMEADLLEAIRDKLAQKKVFIFSSVDELIQEGTLTTVKMTFTFVDGESGEQFSVTYYGTGDDKGDKGAYKAYTGALKYFLMKTFLVPTGDDPEADTETDQRAEGKVVPLPTHAETANKTGSTDKATPAQISKIKSAARAKKLDDQALERIINDIAGKSIESINKAEASKVIDYLLKL